MILGQFIKFLALLGYPANGQGGGGGIGLKSPGVLAQSGAPSSVTGTTSETTLATINIPANAVGANGSLRILTLWSLTNNADTKTTRVRLGGTQFLSLAGGSDSVQQTLTMIFNAGSQSSQVGFPVASSSGLGTSGSSIATGTINMVQAQSLTLTAQLATSTDTVTLLGYLVEVLNP